MTRPPTAAALERAFARLPRDVAARLAALGHRTGDCYLDLDGDVLGWLKVLRSGAWQVAFGVELLFSGPRISLAAGLPAAAAGAALRAWHRRELIDPPGLLETRWGHLLVGGNRRSWKFVAAPRAGAPDTAADRQHR